MAEDVGDSWEDLEESGELDKQLQKLATKGSPKESRVQDESVKMLEDTDRLSYQPQLRILKRQPQSNGNAEQAGSRSRQSKPTKTLAEREAAYAEARLRILGPATGDPDTTNKEGPVRLTQQIEGIRLTENVVRQPKGPDGSKGFDNRDKPR